MKQIKNTEELGGMPLKLNDFRWILNGILEAFKGGLSPFLTDDSFTFVLSGCERTVASGTVTVSEGFVSIGGEICFFPSQSYPVPGIGQIEYFKIEETFDSQGLKAFKNPPIPTLIDTYAIRQGKIEIAGAVPSGHTAYNDVKNYKDFINEFIAAERVNELLNFDVINAGAFTIKTGMAIPYFGLVSNIPDGFLLCDGSSKLVSSYPELFIVIGYENGGSGANFNVPNLIDKFIMGADADAGGTGGANEFTITNDNLPEHSHGVTDPGHSHSHDSYIKSGDGYVNGNDNGDGALQGNSASSGTNSNTTGITVNNGGGVPDPEAIDNRPAFVKALWIIKT